MNFARLFFSAAFLLVPATAQASHCKKLTQILAEFKRVSQQASKADERDQRDLACKLRRRNIALAGQMLQMRNDCFHGGRATFQNLATSAAALGELTCDSASDDEDDFDF
jgi:hypothetical protein